VNHSFPTKDIFWANCAGICTDEATALTGHKKGFQDEVREIAPHVNFMRYIIHREHLSSRDFEPKLHSVLQATVEVVNFVKAHHLNTHLFTNL
jgi:hypothetical protein